MDCIELLVSPAHALHDVRIPSGSVYVEGRTFALCFWTTWPETPTPQTFFVPSNQKRFASDCLYFLCCMLMCGSFAPAGSFWKCVCRTQCRGNGLKVRCMFLYPVCALPLLRYLTCFTQFRSELRNALHYIRDFLKAVLSLSLAFSCNTFCLIHLSLFSLVFTLVWAPGPCDRTKLLHISDVTY